VSHQSARGLAGGPSNSTIECHRGAVVRVIETMRSHLEEPLSLRGMAKVALLSPFHFNRTFRRMTGIPPVQFLYALRMEMAQKLLLNTQHQVTEVCYEVGYSSPGTFTRRFTELVGVSPTRLRSLPVLGSSLGMACADALGDLREPPESGCIAGNVTAPPGFSGSIFVGLFQEPIPQRRPVACAVLTEPGAFRIDRAPDGDYYLFAMGLAAHPSEWFDDDSPLRAGGGTISIAHGCAEGCAELALRPRSPLDPPILASIPALLQQTATTQLTPLTFSDPVG
jgi:AraC family transcriptional regulator